MIVWADSTPCSVLLLQVLLTFLSVWVRVWVRVRVIYAAVTTGPTVRRRCTFRLKRFWPVELPE